MPAIISSSDETAPATPAGLLVSSSFSQKWPRPMETSGSLAVITARTGAISVPCWKAFWLSRKPSGAITASA
jgi:hypothetical protein